MPIQHIHIIGGARGIGRWFVEHVFASSGLPVTVYDIDLPSDLPSSPTVTIRRIRYHSGMVEGIPTFTSTDMFVLAVPVSALRETCAALFPAIPAGCLVVDMASVKVETHAIMAEYAAGRLSLLGIHSLFGPLVASPVGQIVALTGYDAQDERQCWFHQLLKERGFLVQTVSPEAHDEYMLYVQVLTHFMLLTFARVLVRSGVAMSDLLDLRTPPFTFLSAFAGRLLGGNALTYANIQRLAGAAQVRAAVQQAVEELDAHLSSSSLDEAVRAIGDLSGPFSGTEISECFSLSNRAIDSVQQVEQRLFVLAASSTLCGLQRTGASKVYVGVVVEVSDDRILFEERARHIKQAGDRYAVCANEQARTNYASDGINFGTFRRFELLKRNIRILTDDEFQAWLDTHALPIQRDITISAPACLAPAFYEQYLPQLVPALLSASFAARYQKHAHEQRVTLAVAHRADIATEALMQEVDIIIQAMTTGAARV
jgi:prephenate dehydrogenase/ferredoxin-fold anticodon binding domain-containing protein